jgi:hypothetical protein
MPDVGLKHVQIVSLGRGVTRIGCANVGFADVAANYVDGGWDVEVQQTNIDDAEQLAALVQEFRKTEGLS